MRTVIITRPRHQAQPWLQALQARGIHTVNIPLLEISPCASPSELHVIQQAQEKLNRYAWVMFVSPNAVDYFFEQACNQAWPASARAGSPGEGTTQALLRREVPLELIDQPGQNQHKDSEHLWQNIQHRNWKNTNVLVIRGTSSAQPPRNWLIEQLQGAGAQVDTLVVYKRQPVMPAPELQTWLRSTQAQQACWLFSSAEALKYLCDYNWTQTTAIVTHPRIAQAARLAGFGQVICTRPDLHTLVETVESVV